MEDLLEFANNRLDEAIKQLSKKSRHKEKDRAAHKTLLPSMAAKIGGLGGSRMRTHTKLRKT